MTLTGTPTNDDAGASNILLNLSDGELIVSASFELVVNPVNDPPLASDKTVEGLEDQSIDIIVYGDDEDSEGIIFSIVSDPLNGTVSQSRAFAGFTYTPNQNYNGTDSFIFSVSDGEYSDDGEVLISIAAVNDAPTANDASIDLNENTNASVSFTAEDIDGDQIEINIVSGPSNGILDESGLYTPNTGYSGADLIVYNAFDGNEYSNQASITLNIIDVNDPPVAFDLEHYLDEDNSTSVMLQGFDPDNDDLSFSITSSPSHGSVQLIGNLVLYTPNDNFFGDDVLLYNVNDGEYDY